MTGGSLVGVLRAVPACFPGIAAMKGGQVAEAPVGKVCMSARRRGRLQTRR